MDPRTRRQLTRYGAPAAFLAAVTIAVVLVKSGLDTGGSSQPTPAASPITRSSQRTHAVTTKLVLSAPPATTSSTTTTTSTTATTTSVAGAQYYVVKTGDTLGGIAAKYGKTVEELMRLNPTVDPTALHPGDQIRVG